jgi:hypothetical protein
MIAFAHVKPLVSLYTLKCDDCDKAVEIIIDERQGAAATQLATLEPYERAALSRLGCPHAAPPPAPAVEPEDA